MQEEKEAARDDRKAEMEYELMVKQHQTLQEMMMEDEIKLREGKLARAELETVMRTAEEVRILEAKLKYENEARIRKLEAITETEVLQTRTVPLEEVKRDLPRMD